MRRCLIASKPADSVVTHINRDYLGVISAIGTDATAGKDAAAAARAQESWPVTGPRS